MDINDKLSKDSVISWGKEVCQSEAKAIKKMADGIDHSFYQAVKALMQCEGKIVTTGLGKSGYIARKMASTLASTGTPSFYLHPAEALHGDFGMLQPGDGVVAIAYGGETREVLGVVHFAKRLQIPVVAITGKNQSSLAKSANFTLDSKIEKEADGLGLAPTASSTAALAMCDAISVALMKSKNFSSKDFAALHPGGSLGKKFALISSFYRKASELKSVSLDADFHQVLEAITNPNFGIIPVLSASNKVLGAISDGDIRRAFLQHNAEALKFKAEDFMTGSPKVILSSEPLMTAVARMEQSSIISLFVVSSQGHFEGLIRLHDLISAKII